MDRDNSIVAQVAIKAAAEFVKDGNLGDVLEAASLFEQWVHEVDLRWPVMDGNKAYQNRAPVPRPAEIPTGCPKCGSEMWDNRFDKKNPKGPDFKCKNRGCQHPIWLQPKAPVDSSPPF